MVCGRVARRCGGAPPAGVVGTSAEPDLERGCGAGEVRGGRGCAGGGWWADGAAARAAGRGGGRKGGGGGRGAGAEDEAPSASGSIPLARAVNRHPRNVLLENLVNK